MNLPKELSADEAKLRAAAAAALANASADARADEALAKTWLQANVFPALAIAVSFLVLGLAIGVKIGEHVAK